MWAACSGIQPPPATDVLNEGKPLQVDVTSEKGPYTVSNTYLLPQARQTPRFVRLSVQYDF